ncbi:hypothetical protein [Blastococcus sp. TF02A-30]|uniref:hypothetical protein n=1 Tax=Blastococcus sp. TF02A-30 TaxID=2250580 RepID=UPI001314D8B2|nr:hypothetical protein [Blastococcus sp. TF02A-30]
MPTTSGIAKSTAGVTGADDVGTADVEAAGVGAGDELSAVDVGAADGRVDAEELVVAVAALASNPSSESPPATRTRSAMAMSPAITTNQGWR